MEDVPVSSNMTALENPPLIVDPPFKQKCGQKTEFLGDVKSAMFADTGSFYLPSGKLTGCY